MITENHKKAIYKEDGIVNGARGWVQSIQVSKNDPNKVDVVWIVFNNPKVDQLYRFEHQDLRKKFDPKHPLATPILPT